MPSKYAVSRKTHSPSKRHTRKIKQQSKAAWNQYLQMLEDVYDIDPTTQIEHTPNHMLMVRAYIGFLPILRMFPKIVYAPLPEDLFDFYTEKQIWALLKICYDAMDEVFKDKIVITDEHARYASDVLSAVAMSGQYEFEKFVLGYNGIQKQSGGGKESELHAIFEKQFSQDQHGGMPNKKESNNNNSSNSNNNNSSNSNNNSSTKSNAPTGTQQLSTFVQGGQGTPTVASGLIGAAGLHGVATMESSLGNIAGRLNPEQQQQLIKRAQEVKTTLTLKLGEAIIAREEQRSEGLVVYAKQEAEEEQILLKVLGDPAMRIGERVIELIANMDKEEEKNQIKRIIANTMKTLHAKFVMNRGAIYVEVDGKEQLIAINDIIQAAQRLDIIPKGSGYAQYILALAIGPTVGDEEGTFTITDKATSPLIMLIAASGSGYGAYKILAPIFTKTRPLSNPTPSYTGMIPVLHHDSKGNRLENVEIENKAGHLAVLKGDVGGIIQFKKDEVDLFPLAGDKRVGRKFAPMSPRLKRTRDGFVGQKQVVAERGPAAQVDALQADRQQRLEDIAAERKQFQCGELEEIQRKLEQKRALLDGSDGLDASLASLDASLASIVADVAKLNNEKKDLDKKVSAFQDESLLELKKSENGLRRIKDEADDCQVDVEPPRLKVLGVELPAMFQRKAPKAGECPTDAFKRGIQQQIDNVAAKKVRREKELEINNVNEGDAKAEAAGKAAELREKQAELLRKQAELARKQDAHGRVKGEISALQVRANKIPNEEQCQELDEDQEVLDEAVPWWRVENPVKNGKHGLVLVDVNDITFIDACPPGFRHDKLQCIPISPPSAVGANGKPKFNPNRYNCHAEQGKAEPVCLPRWEFEQKQSAWTIPLGITSITLAAETTVMIDCAGKTLYYIGGTSALAGTVAYGATYAATSYLPNIGPVKYIKGALPPIVGVGTTLVWGYTSLTAYECSVPIGFAISTLGYSTVAVVGGVGLSVAAVIALVYALRNFYRIHRRKRILAKSEKLVEKTEGIVWNQIKKEYLSTLIAEAAKTKGHRSSEELYNTFLGFSTQIRSDVKKEIFNAHKKWEAAVKAWTESKVPSIRGKKPEFSDYISETLKDKIIDDLVKGFILDTLQREENKLRRSIEKQKLSQRKALDKLKGARNLTKLKAANPKLGAQVEAAENEADADLKLLDTTEVDDALRIVIIEEIQKDQEVKNIIKEIFGFKLSETGRAINVTKNKNLISLDTARAILEMARAGGKGKKGKAAKQHLHTASAAAETLNATTSRGLGEIDRGLQINMPSNAAYSSAAASKAEASKPASQVTHHDANAGAKAKAAEAEEKAKAANAAAKAKAKAAEAEAEAKAKAEAKAAEDKAKAKAAEDKAKAKAAEDKAKAKDAEAEAKAKAAEEKTKAKAAEAEAEAANAAAKAKAEAANAAAKAKAKAKAKANANGEVLANGAVVSNESSSRQGNGVRRDGEEPVRGKGGSRYLNKTRKNRSKN